MQTSTNTETKTASPPPDAPASSSSLTAPSHGSAPRLDKADAARLIAERTALVRLGRQKTRPDDAGGVSAALPPAPATPPAPERLTEAERELRERALKCWGSAGVPPRYVETADFRKLSDEIRRKPSKDGSTTYGDTVEDLRTLLETPATIALIGTRGSGKTWMACGLVREFCRLGKFALYRDAMDYFLELKATYDQGAKLDQQQVEARYIKPTLLVLDEAHERGDTLWEDRMLTRLINKRYAANLATVLIANQTEEKFKERVGESIYDRIHDGGGVIVCDWDSLRGRIQ